MRPSRLLTAMLVLLGLFIPAPAAFAADMAKPNIVLIISDDHAWMDYGFMGHKEVRTPHIDRLAARGLTFTRGYVPTALCSPSLASILSGKYPHQHGITGNDPVKGKNREAWNQPFLRNPLLPRLLARLGYLTLHTGKFWMGIPVNAGFTHDMGETGRHGGQALVIGRQTMRPIYDFMDRARTEKKPFFVWYAPLLPHQPHNPPDRLFKKYAQVKDTAKAKYYAMVEWLDETCGDLMENLRTRGIDDNTIIIYLADNGWHAFGKGTPYENGVRTPIIVRWPEKIRPRMDREHLASSLDILPTLLAVTGGPLPENLPGVNLLDDQAVAARDTLFLANFGHDMVSAAEPAKSLWTRSCIHGNWKLITWRENPPNVKPSGGTNHKDPGAMLELYNLASDPTESKNLAKQHPERVRDLQTRLDAWWNPDGKR